MVYTVHAETQQTHKCAKQQWLASQRMSDARWKPRKIIKNRCNHVWNWNIIDAVNGRAKQKEERSQYIDVACQNGDSKVNEEILCSFGYLFKNQCTPLDWIDLQ